MNLTVSFDGEFENKTVESVIKAVLESENISCDCEVEVVITGSEEIRALNLETRNIDRVTDVLSYPMFDSKEDIEPDESGTAFLGSMVICCEKAISQAEEYGHSVTREAAFLAAHSALHLLGYDHELGAKEEKEMFDKQRTVLDSMGITR